MWIQLIKPKRLVDKKGRPVMHDPGEILQIKNREICRNLIRDGIAVDVADAAQYIPPGSGVLVRRKMGMKPHWIEALDLGMEIGTKGPFLPFALTVIWDPRYTPNRAELASTFRVLREYPWDLAVPIKSYAKLAKSIGTVEDRRRTEKVIREMRIPYFNTCLMFVKRNERTQELIKLWIEEMKAGGDECLAFMRAVYRVKPYLLALPSSAAARTRRA